MPSPSTDIESSSTPPASLPGSLPGPLPGPLPVHGQRTERVLAELAQILFYQPLITIMLCQIIGIIVMSLYFWQSVADWILISWTAYMVILSLTFMGTTQLYRNTPEDQRQLRRWISLFPLAGVLLGLGWASIGFWPGVLHTTDQLIFTCLVVMGMAAAGIAVIGPYLRAFVPYASLIALSFAAQLLWQDTRLHSNLAIMLLVYLVVIIISAYHMKRAVRQSIHLRLDKLELVESLVEKNALAETARQQAEQADISKSRFLAAASHDLRQPLHALGLFVDALDSRVEDIEQRELVDNIRISTEALSDLLNSLLDISKLDAGVLKARPQHFSLRPLLQRVQTDFKQAASHKGLQLRISDCHFVVNTDPAMLERIIRNLVANAIRYTQKGGLVLGCRRRDESVSIEVFDTGLGIPTQEKDKIFDEFYQIENPERDRRKGLGLGLAIVKRLSDLMGCAISIDSSPGRGSVFRVRVPFITTAPTQASTPTNFVNDVAGTRVLVIDDEALVRQGMRKILEEWECQVVEAESIDQALSQLNNECAVDIIMTDYRLRENTTGIEAIEAVQAHCKTEIPAIILTGDTDPKRLKEAKTSGYRLLHKPVSSAKMRSLMSYLLDRSSA